MARSTKRDDILQAALKLIVQHDLDHTSMEMIAREANTGMGTIYNYFPSKEVLVNELYREMVGRLSNAIQNNYSADAPIREQFFTVVRNKFCFYMENLDVAQFIEQFGYSPIIAPEVQAFAMTVWQIPIQIMERGRNEQIIKDLPIQMLILLSSSAIFSLVKLHSTGHIPLDSDLIEAAITACWDAIKR